MPKATRGARYAAAVRAEYELNESQHALVDVIADTMDVLDGLPVSEVAERRQQKLVLLRALSQLALPDVGADVARTATAASDRGRRAARARWDHDAAS
jgi:hypothetical protein